MKIYKQIEALINKKHGSTVTHANLFDEILEIAKAAREEGYNNGILNKAANETGIPVRNIRDRLSRNWSIERALTEPVRKKPQPSKYTLIKDNPFRKVKV